ncbi:MAG: YheV family putative metal-binding protein [Pseudomonadales bacterium]
MSRRFIAGARCQECGAEDTLFLESGAASDVIRCVSCSFQEARPQPHDSAEAGRLLDDTVPQVIEIIDAST